MSLYDGVPANAEQFDLMAFFKSHDVPSVLLPGIKQRKFMLRCERINGGAVTAAEVAIMRNDVHLAVAEPKTDDGQLTAALARIAELEALLGESTKPSKK